MVNRLVSVGDDFTLPAAVKAADGNLPTHAKAATLAATYATPRFARPKPTRTPPQIKQQTTFQAGHGWTANTGTWTTDTAVFALGSQSIKTTVTSALAASYRKFTQPVVDVSARDFAVLIKVDVPTELDQIQLYLGKDGMTNYEVMIPSKGGISANSTILPNVWTWVYFTWADVGNPFGTPNRALITDWQLRVVGKSATPVTVWFNAVGHYPRRAVFPTGCISFAADDGRLSQYTKMTPALDKYGYGATAYLIVDYLGTANKMTYAQAKELENSHRWEIAGHAYTQAAHDNGMTSLSLADLDTELRKLRDWLQQGNHKGADLFAYPLGYDNPDVVEVVSRYFTNARQIIRAPYQNVDLDQPYRMRSNSMSSSDLLATAKTWVDKAVTNGTWFTITMHDIVDGAPAAGTEWSTADFQELVDYVAASGAEVLPVGAALDRIAANQPSFAPGASFKRAAAGGANTTGDNIKVGGFAYGPTNVGTTYVQGGATSYENVIGGNTANVNTATSNLAGAPALVAPNGNWSAILHGYDNVNNGWANVITGFHCYAIAGSNHGTIAGGSDHKIEGTDVSYATISGGTGNQITAIGGTISGGYSHTVTGTQGTVAGGLSNDATGAISTVGGGQNNTASGNNSSVAGGSGNTASGAQATVGGGLNNSATNLTATVAGGSGSSASNQYASVGGGLTTVASGIGATVPGGRENTALGNYSVTTGRGAATTMEGQRSHASGFFAVQGDAQVSEFVARNTSTDAVAKELFLQGTGSRLTLPDDSTWFFEINVVARRTDADGESAAYRYTGCIDRGAGAATTAFVGTVTETVVAEDNAAWGVAITAGTTDGTLRITATGEAAKSIRWVAYVRAVTVTG